MSETVKTLGTIIGEDQQRDSQRGLRYDGDVA
jgi:hypothetical protein